MFPWPPQVRYTPRVLLKSLIGCSSACKNNRMRVQRNVFLCLLVTNGTFGEGIIEREAQNSLCSPDQRKCATPQVFFSKAWQGIVARVKTLVCVCREICFPDLLSRPVPFGEGIIEHEAQNIFLWPAQVRYTPTILLKRLTDHSSTCKGTRMRV